MKNDMMYIPYDAEYLYYIQLIEEVVRRKFVDTDTAIVCCQPQYSSSLCQVASHKLSYLNDNNLLEIYNLEIPFGGMKQIFNQESLDFENFDVYLQKWLKKYGQQKQKYLFLANVMHNPFYRKLHSNLRASFHEGDFLVGSVFSPTAGVGPQGDISVVVDDRRPLFEWENMDNNDKSF